MKKIANITWITYPNFGTFLQAYALQQYIISQGYEDAILDDSTIIESTLAGNIELKSCYWNLIFHIVDLPITRRNRKRCMKDLN